MGPKVITTSCFADRDFFRHLGLETVADFQHHPVLNLVTKVWRVVMNNEVWHKGTFFSSSIAEILQSGSLPENLEFVSIEPTHHMEFFPNYLCNLAGLRNILVMNTYVANFGYQNVNNLIYSM
jgi:hypothetical protein